MKSFINIFTIVMLIFFTATIVESREYKAERIELGNTSIVIPVPTSYDARAISDLIWNIARTTILKPSGEKFTNEEINNILSWSMPENWNLDEKLISNEHTFGSCDTDAHCADTAAYRRQGIISVYYTSKNTQHSGNEDSDVVVVECIDNRIIYTKDDVDKFDLCTPTTVQTKLTSK